MKRLFPALLLAVLAASGAAAAAGPSQPIDLNGALREAMAQNCDIHKADEYRNYVLGVYHEYRAGAFPNVTITTTGARSRDKAQQSAGFEPDITQSKLADIGVNWTIFTWGQVSAAIRAARANMADADVRLRMQQQAVVRDVSAGFYDCLLARELIAIATDNLRQKQRLHEEARRRLAAGVATDYDVLAAAVAVENAKPTLLAAINTLQRAKNNLSFLLGGDTRNLEPEGTLEVELMPPPSFDSAFATAVAHRPELESLKLQLAMNQDLITVAKAGDKPSVALSSSIGWHEYEYDHLPAWTGQSWSAGITMTYPIFDGFRTRGKVEEAMSNYRTTIISVAKARDQIGLDVDDAINAVTEAAAIVRALEGNVAQAEKLLNMAEKGYAAGVKTRIEVDDANLNLMKARGELARARRNYLVAQVTLQWVMGTIDVEAYK